MTESRTPDEWLRLAEQRRAEAASRARTTIPDATSGVAHNRVPPPPARPRPAAADRQVFHRPRRPIDVAEPRLTQALLAVMVGVFVLQQVSPTLDRDILVNGALIGQQIAAGHWWQLVTPAFLHGDLLHLGFNGYLLWIVGGQLERAMGHARYATLFFGSVLGGSLGALLLDPQSVAVGASGGVFGIFGAYAVILLLRGQNPMRSSIGSLILINLVFTFAVPNISIGGHVGGLLAGALLGGIVTYARDRDLDRVGVAAAVATSLVLGLAGYVVAIT